MEPEVNHGSTSVSKNQEEPDKMTSMIEPQEFAQENYSEVGDVDSIAPEEPIEEVEEGSIVDTTMVHTEFTKQDNPFVEDDKSEKDDNSITKKKGLANPNQQYKNQEDQEDPDEVVDLPMNSENSSGTTRSSSRNSNHSMHTDSSPPSPHAMHQTCNSHDKVHIVEATKVSEGQSRNYIAYTIKYGGATVRRRYSEFESLRKILVKLFPMTLIPPIPEKQSITSYGKSITGSKSNYLLPSEGAGSVDLSLSVINGSVNTNDEKLIRHRIRMLTSFLNRLLKNEEITKTSIITDFLNPNNTNWNDVITSSATISSLPKSVLQCNPLDPTNTTMAHAFLPIPSSSTQLLLNKDSMGNNTSIAETDDCFATIENEYKHYEFVLSNRFYKYNRRITKNLHEMRQDMKELCEAFADFSNDQKRGAELAEQLSHLSDAFDESAIHLETIVGKLYYNVNEPLSETVHMAGAARELLRYRKLKVFQRDILVKTLLYKRGQLKKLEEQEDDAKRIDDIVEQEMSKSGHVNFKNPERKTYSGKLMSRINKLATIVKETVNYQDPDPTTTIKNLEKDIEQLSESLDVSEADLKVISSTIKNVELPKFSREKDKELSSILKTYSKYLKDYARKNLEAWQEVKNREQN